MLNGTLVSKRSRKASKNQQNKPQTSRQSQLKRLTLLLSDRQQQLKQSQRLNRLYLTQINKLEDDNLALCLRLEELKAVDERTSRQLVFEGQKAKGQLAELLNVVSYLQRDSDHFRQESKNLNLQIEQMSQAASVGRLAQLQLSQLGIELEKAKLKLVQSQKYWMTRCETLLSEKEAELQRRVGERQSELLLKMRGVEGQLANRQRQVQDKTEEIYKLIAFIHSRA